MKRLLLLFLFAAHLCHPGLEAAAQVPPAKHQILFLGDSITQAGSYVAFFELYLWDRFPDSDLHIVNLGLGSETASGNNEPDHPYPRPVIHERLGRILADSQIDPDLVFFDYGMNDGIYHPLSPERFADYRAGIGKLVTDLAKDGRHIIAMTPTPFDVVSKRLKSPDSLIPDASPGFPFGYKKTWYGYDQVLMTYGRWLRELGEKDGRIIRTIDLHTPMIAYLHERRATEPDLAFGDGVHPPVEGHLVMALSILAQLGYDRNEAETRLTELTGISLHPTPESPNQPTPLWADMTKRKTLLVNAWLEHIGHTKPNKLKTGPLAEVQETADRLEQAIRKRLN